MRCHEALKRLALMEEARLDPNSDPEFLAHLTECASCARQTEAARQLRRALAEAAPSDPTDRIPWSEQIRRVEAEAARSRPHQTREKTFMSTIKKQLVNRPKLSFGLAAAVVVIMAVTLIPFKFDQTVGFEVAVAGVDRDLAVNDQKLQEFFVQLGIPNAAARVDGCDVTCNLTVSNLQSAEEAEMLKVAFEQVGEGQVMVELRPIREDVSGNVLKFAANNIWFGENELNVDETKLTNVVIEKLGVDFKGEGIFFHSSDGELYEVTGTGADGTPHNIAWFGVQDSGTEEPPHVFISYSDGTGDKAGEIHFSTSDGQPRPALIDYDQIIDGRLTAEAVEALEAMGYEVKQSSNDDGTLSIRLIPDEGRSDEVYEYRMDLPDQASDPDAAAKEAELPEGYELMQNYPNPFNPTTTIEYTLPHSDLVKLDVFNVNGQRVRTLVDEAMPAGHHSVEWDARDDGGSLVASGVYFYRLTAGGVTASKKMTLLK